MRCIETKKPEMYHTDLMRLIETWDVLKLSSPAPISAPHKRLIETWDVLKQPFYNFFKMKIAD